MALLRTESFLPVDEVPRVAEDQAHKVWKKLAPAADRGKRVKDLGFPPPPLPPGRRSLCSVGGKMGSPTSWSYGRIVSLILILQLVSVSGLQFLSMHF